MKLNSLSVVFAVALLCLAVFAAAAFPVFAASDNTSSDNTSPVYLQTWGHSAGQSSASGWGNTVVWYPSLKG